VLGIPGPGRASGTPAGCKRIDDYGRLAELNHAGWAVDYKRYQSTDLIDLPEEIMVLGHKLRVKLIVSEWDLIGT
jgi:outer membrane biogenesis lipoprotein LolB